MRSREDRLPPASEVANHGPARTLNTGERETLQEIKLATTEDLSLICSGLIEEWTTIHELPGAIANSITSILTAELQSHQKQVFNTLLRCADAGQNLLRERQSSGNIHPVSEAYSEFFGLAFVARHLLEKDITLANTVGSFGELGSGTFLKPEAELQEIRRTLERMHLDLARHSNSPIAHFLIQEKQDNTKLANTAFLRAALRPYWLISKACRKEAAPTPCDKPKTRKFLRRFSLFKKTQEKATVEPKTIPREYQDLGLLDPKDVIFIEELISTHCRQRQAQAQDSLNPRIKFIFQQVPAPAIPENLLNFLSEKPDLSDIDAQYIIRSYPGESESKKDICTGLFEELKQRGVSVRGNPPHYALPTILINTIRHIRVIHNSEAFNNFQKSCYYLIERRRKNYDSKVFAGMKLIIHEEIEKAKERC